MAEQDISPDSATSEPAVEQQQPIESGQTGTGQAVQEPVQDAQPNAADQPEAAVPEQTKDGKPILDPNNLPPDASQADRDYAAQMQRYFTKRTQSMAEEQKKLQQYEQFFNSSQWRDMYNSYTTQKTQPPQYQQPSSSQPNVDAQSQYLQRQYEDALQSGDTQRLLQINDAILDHKLSQKEKVYQQTLNQIRQENQMTRAQQKRFEDSQMLEDYGKLNPDFWQDNQDGGAEAFIGYYVDVKGLTLPQAHEKLRQYRQKLTQRVMGSTQKRIAEKKNAVSQAPTTPQSSEVIYVDTVEQERRMNYKLAMEGSSKIAKVKPRT